MSILELYKGETPTFDSLVLDEFYTLAEDDLIHALFAHLDKEGFELTQYEKLCYELSGVRLEDCLGHSTAQYPWLRKKDSLEGNVYVDHCLTLYRFGLSDEGKDYIRSLLPRYRPVASLLHLIPKGGLDIALDYIDEQGIVTEMFHIERDYHDLDVMQDDRIKWEQNLLGIDWEDVGEQIIKHKPIWCTLSGVEQANWKVTYVLGNSMKSENVLRTIV